MNSLQKYGPPVARLMIGLIFLWSGYGKLMDLAGTAGYIHSKGLPLPSLLAFGAMVLELAGGLALVLGWNARWAAAALIFVCLFSAIFFHGFWSVPADQVRMQTIHFLKNVAMAGGILLVMVQGSGPLSLSRDPAS